MTKILSSHSNLKMDHPKESSLKMMLTPNSWFGSNYKDSRSTSIEISELHKYHVFIPAIISYDTSPSNCYIEYENTGTILHEYKVPVEIGIKYSWIYFIADQLELLHANGYKHRKVSSSSIRIDTNNFPHLAEYEEAAKVIPYSSSNFHGSGMYSAPEVLESANYTPKSDIYSLGCLFYFIFTRNEPFSRVERLYKHLMLKIDTFEEALNSITIIEQNMDSSDCYNECDVIIEALKILENSGIPKISKPLEDKNYALNDLIDDLTDDNTNTFRFLKELKTMFSNALQYVKDSYEKKMKKICKEESSSCVTEDYPLKDIAIQCLATNPESRPNAGEIKKMILEEAEKLHEDQRAVFNLQIQKGYLKIAENLINHNEYDLAIEKLSKINLKELIPEYERLRSLIP